MKEAKSYTSAWKELQGILADIESDDLNIDKLAEKVKRASYLINYCQEKLRSVEKELDDHLTEE